MCLREYYKVKEIADVFCGYSRSALRKKSKLGYGKNIQKYKIACWQEIEQFKGGIHHSYEAVGMLQTYEKKIRYMKKGDLIFPEKSGIDNTKIIYIDKEPEDKFIYDNTVIVVRITDTSIDNLYVYVMCQSETIQNGLRQQKWKSILDERGRSQSGIVPRLSKGILSNMLIRKLPEQERKDIVNEYIKLKEMQDKFSKKIKELQADKDNRANICWL